MRAILTARIMSFGMRLSVLAAIFGVIGSLISSSLSRERLNQTSFPVFLLYRSEPVSPGITITGAFPITGVGLGVGVGVVVGVAFAGSFWPDANVMEIVKHRTTLKIKRLFIDLII